MIAETERHLSFIGRLGTYRYMNMDEVIGEALQFAQQFLQAYHDRTPPPVFPNCEPDLVTFPIASSSRLPLLVKG